MAFIQEVVVFESGELFRLKRRGGGVMKLQQEPCFIFKPNLFLNANEKLRGAGAHLQHRLLTFSVH